MCKIQNMNLSTVDLNLLIAFDALMEHRHVTRAAEAIGRSQPAMSNALARLRELFEDQLLVRSAGAMVPTPRALALHERIRRALEQIDIAMSGGSDFVPAQSSRTFTVGMAELTAFPMLPRLTRRLAREAPSVNVNILSVALVPGLELLTADECELVVTSMPANLPPQVENELLYTENIVCMARPDHPAFAGDFTLEDYLAYPHITVQPNARILSIIDQALAAIDRRRRVAVRVPHLLLVPQLLADSDLIANLPRRVAEYFLTSGDFVVRPAPFEIPAFRACLAWHRRFRDDLGHAWFRGLLREIAAEI
jgi:DNA-binding transcriptional LysR family regulator